MNLKSIFSFLFREKATPEMVTVPEGHKVVVIRGSVQPVLYGLESGVCIADFGQTKDSDSLFEQVTSNLEFIKKAMIVWIIQEQSFGGLVQADHSSITQNYRKIKTELKDNAQVIVFVKEASLQYKLMNELVEIGFGIHYSAQDGACLVEVHKPDGSITIGMAGNSYNM